MAGRISGRTGLPHTELDSIFHQADWTPIPTDEFRERVDAVTSTPGWVICGNYTVVRDILWERADTVIAFDLPRATNMWRVLRRTVSRLLKRQVLWNGNRETLRNILAFHDEDRSILRWAWSAHGRKHREIADIIQDPQWRDKTLLVIRNQQDADRILALFPGSVG